MIVLEGTPLKGKERQQLSNFLESRELRYEDQIEYSVCIINDAYEIIATGSVEENVLKCIAVSEDCMNEGLSATIMSYLIQYEFAHGRTKLFLYTKPKNAEIFREFGFYEILRTEQVLLMENSSSGIQNYKKQLIEETPDKFYNQNKTGAIVANCNPFTYGHQYLIEQACKECDVVHMFILSDNRSMIPANERYKMVYQAVKDIPNLVLHKTSDYMISAATFPSYFIKDQKIAKEANCQLDLELFGQKIAPVLNITDRYVGTEPLDHVTDRYNEMMKKILPSYGIQVHEVERKKVDGEYISASKVRQLYQNENYEKLLELVPSTTMEILLRNVTL